VLSVLSQRVPVLVLRKNFIREIPKSYILVNYLIFDADVIKNIYGYHFDLKHIENTEAIPVFNGSTVLIERRKSFMQLTFLMVLIFSLVFMVT
jgi:hypothetical protein